MTGTSTIERSLRLIGALAPGEEATPEEAEDCLESLGAMLDNWRTQSLLCYTVKEHKRACVADQAAYTIGPGGDFDIPRPVFPFTITCIDNTNAVQPLHLLVEMLTLQQWEQIPVRNIRSRLFTRAYYEPDFPLSRVWIWPIVNVVATEIALRVQTAITGLADLATEFTFAPGYEDAIVYNLAVRLGPEFGNEIPAIVMKTAQESLADVKRTNIVPAILVSDPALLFYRGARYNWRSDQNG